jgi:iron-sulfur cluster repair protein YtfE (RIC family)
LSYLEDERWVLSPLIGNDSVRATFHERQNNIRKLTEELDMLDHSDHRGLGVLSMLADALDDYVRWEEHTLFPGIEEGIERDQLRQLSKLTSKIEANRTRPTQTLHRSVNAKPPARAGGSLFQTVLLMALGAGVLKLIMSALQIGSTEWLRMRIRSTWGDKPPAG